MSDATPLPIPAVAQWLEEEVPDVLRGTITALRSLIYQVAFDEDAWPLVEEVKWNQPSYRSPHANESTPVRLGWTPTGDVALLAHCQSSVIPDFRDAFGDQFRFEGNRAVLFGTNDKLHPTELAQLIGHALTYRRPH